MAASRSGYFSLALLSLALSWPDGVGRVADDDPDVEGFETFEALVVLGEDLEVGPVVVLPGLEGVGEDEPFEGRVRRPARGRRARSW